MRPVSSAPAIWAARLRSPRRKRPGGDRIAVACSTRERSEAAAQRLGCTAETPQRILSDSRFVFLGVKPQMVVGVVESLKADILASEGIFVSMLAGVSLEKLALLLGADKKIIRIMPNTPCAVGQGLILYAANGRVSEDELCAFRELMAPAGALDELNEHLIDAASAVSGCGPAYAYLFIEALADGGVKNGLPAPRHSAMPRRCCSAAPKWCSAPAGTRDSSRTRCAAPAAAPSRASPRWSAAASAARASRRWTPPWKKPNSSDKES